MDVLKVSDSSTRAEIEQAIKVLRARQDRMPRAWDKQRAEVGDEIDRLVDQWLVAVA